MGTGSFSQGSGQGMADHLPPSNAKVKEGVELFLFSPQGLNSNECFLCVLFAYVNCAVR